METDYPSETVHPMPLLDRLTNIVASPGELFENVRLTGPTNSNWLVPWLMYVLVAIATGQLIIANPSLSGQLERTIREQFNESIRDQVMEGQITQEQADEQFEQFASPESPWFTLLSIAGTLIGTLLVLFALSLFYQLLGRSAMNATAPYMKVVEVVGLTFFLGVLERIVATTLMFLTDSIHSSPSLAIFLPAVDLQDKAHVALSKMNLFTFWSVAVVSVGLSKIFQRDFPKVLTLVIALWILWTLFSIFTGFSLGG